MNRLIERKKQTSKSSSSFILVKMCLDDSALETVSLILTELSFRDTLQKQCAQRSMYEDCFLGGGCKIMTSL